MKIDNSKKRRRLENENIAVGVEFKSLAKMSCFHSQFEFMKQCVDYSHINFKDYGFISILGCPGFEFDKGYSGKKSLTSFIHFLNSFYVGELYETYRG